MKNRSQSHNLKIDIFWCIIFADSIVLALRYGGLAVVDLFFHSACLVMATLFLWTNGRFFSISRVWLVLFGGMLLLGVLMLVPLPPALFPLLAPIKYRVVETVTGIYPQTPFSREIAMIPELHLYKLAELSLDFYLISLLCIAPRPRRFLMKSWLLILAVSTGLLAILQERGLLMDHPLLYPYEGSFGGLVNQNHYVVFSVALLIMLFQKLLNFLFRLYGSIRRYGRFYSSELLKEYMGVALFGTTFLITFLGFGLIWSRSGIFLLLFAFAGFGAILGFQYFRNTIAARWKIFVPVLTLSLLSLLFVPLGRSPEKIYKKGFEDENRMEYLRIGFDYLKEGQILGSGLGSSEAMLNAVEPRDLTDTINTRSYHNEYLEVLVEYGYLGFAGLVFFILLVLKRLFENFREASKHEKLFLAAVGVSLLTFLLHSLVAFPLRVTSIRVFCLILLGIGLHQKRFYGKSQKNGRRQLLAVFPVLVAAFVFFSSATIKVKNNLNNENKKIQKEIKYGRFFRSNYFKANNELKELFSQKFPKQEIYNKIETIKNNIYKFLAEQPLSIKALNILFILDVIEIYLTNTILDRNSFEILKERAIEINKLGKDSNIHSKSSLFYLYAQDEKLLKKDELEFYEDIKNELKKELEDAEQQLKNALQ